MPTLKQYSDADLLHCNKSEGWTQAQTAKDLGISQPAVRKAIKIATAIEDKPELASSGSGQILKPLKQPLDNYISKVNGVCQ